MGPAESFVLCLCASMGWYCGALTSASKKFNALWGLVGHPLLSVCGELSDLLVDLCTGLNSPGGTFKVKVAVASQGRHFSTVYIKTTMDGLVSAKVPDDFRQQNTIGLSQDSIFRLTEQPKFRRLCCLCRCLSFAVTADFQPKKSSMVEERGEQEDRIFQRFWGNGWHLPFQFITPALHVVFSFTCWDLHAPWHLKIQNAF